VSRSRLYRDGEVVAENFPATELSARLATDGHTVAWLDLRQPSRDELDRLAGEFGLHRLAVEDVLQQSQRAKVDRYDSHLFLSTYLVRMRADDRLTSAEVAAFITPRALITVHDDNEFSADELLLRWDETGELAEHGVAFLVYGLLDLLVDAQFDSVQRLDSALEAVEDSLLSATGTERRDEIQRRTFKSRRDLVRLRQILLPMREVVNAVMRPTLHIVNAPMLPYFQDVYDHAVRSIEWTESLRDLNTTMLETNLTIQGNRMNLIVKQVTSWAAIIAVPTAITGFYGQNLPFPGRDQTWGVLLSLVLTFGLAGLLYLVFRRKDWL
jgi:magnesium transporter